MPLNTSTVTNQSDCLNPRIIIIVEIIDLTKGQKCLVDIK